MANFKIKTENDDNIEKKSRIYFCCHPKDFELHFERICEDIFKTHDCAVYYTEDMSESIADSEKETTLTRCNLFVIPVTQRLLEEPNRAMNEDVPYALLNHIHILPIMMEAGIDEQYSAYDKFGELQYLNAHRKDNTEITYEEKLKKHLESVLISDELANRVRAAFDAYIFLSYRKKDRKYANELMKLIHNIPECRDIAIWFDEFLTPGESFKLGIEKMLKESRLFTLLVTPNILEKPNYVMDNEYPEARKLGVEVLPIEMEKTDHETLNIEFAELPRCIEPSDVDAFKTNFVEMAKRVATATSDSPEHNFLIGLAYLDGIDVEVNRERGVELITFAADDGLVEAQKKLVDIYKYGIGVERDLRKSCEYKGIINKKLENELTDDFSEINKRLQYLEDHDKYASRSMFSMGLKYEHEKALKFFKALVGEKVNSWCVEQVELGELYSKLGDFEMARLTLSETIDFLEIHTGYDTTDIYCNGIISEPNSDLLNIGLFGVYKKLIQYITDERKFLLLKVWRERLLNWVKKLENKYPNNDDVMHFRRVIELEFSQSLYIDGKYAELKEHLTTLIDEMVGFIKDRLNVDYSDVKIKIVDGVPVFEGPDIFSLYQKQSRYYDFLTEVFLLLGDVNAKLGQPKEALEAYDEALAGNKKSDNISRVNRELLIKLKLAEKYAELEDVTNATLLLSEVETKLGHINKNSLDIISLKRELKRVSGNIGLQKGEPCAEETFVDSLEFAKILSIESPTVENYYYMAELYERIYVTTKTDTTRSNCIEEIYKLTQSRVMNQKSHKSMEALGNTWILMYKCNKDVESLKKAERIFSELVERYPESSIFWAKLYIVKTYKNN